MRASRLLVVSALLATAACGLGGGAERPEGGAAGPTSTTGGSTTTAGATTTTAPPFDGWVDPASAGQPYGDAVQGLLTFRGNPTRSYYGGGPVPQAPQVRWSYPGQAMCAVSVVDEEPKTWCGTGWTGQPSVFERDGRTWVAFGAYDRMVHFVDAENGQDILPPFPTGDIIKGSVTIDPDGFPLLYVGSRDGNYRVIAFDRGEAQELWALNAHDVSPTLYNDDWDGAGLVIDDYLFIGGENSQFHIVKLNRAQGADGLVTVAPELVFNTPSWDDQVLADIGDNDMQVENSVAISGNTVYFANGGGLVQGWDIGPLRDGTGPPVRTFRFWNGDDTDASVVVDAEGMLYVAAEFDRGTARAREVGQLMKLDPGNPDDPLVWSVPDQDTNPAGFWATPALHEDMIYAPTNAGRLLGVDRMTGEIRWTIELPGPTWQSPVVVDDVLIEGDCNGALHAYDVSDTTVQPPELWSLQIGGCIESTPGVWDGGIYVGTRAGQFHAIGDPAA